MAIDFVKNAANYLTYGNNIGALLHGASKIAVSAVVWADSYSATSPTNNANCILRVMQDGGNNGLTFRVNLVSSVPRVAVTVRSVGTDAAQNVTGDTVDLAIGQWHQVGVMIDIAGDSVTPIANGIADDTTGVTFANAVWTLGTPSEPDRIGAHSATPPATNDQWDGPAAELSIWVLGSGDAVFTPAEWLTLGGWSSGFVRPDKRVFYEPFIAAPPVDKIGALAGTITGSLSYVAHPPVLAVPPPAPIIPFRTHLAM